MLNANKGLANGILQSSWHVHYFNACYTFFLSMMRISSMHGSRNWQFLQNMPFERVMATNGR